jgi:hypothetical protein
MERIGQEARRQLKRFGPAGGMADLVAAWPHAVGEEISRNAWPARIARDRTLHVSVSSSAWGFELTHLEGEILGRLRTKLGDGAPARLRFAPGPLPERSAEGVKKVKKPPPQPSADERSAADEIASGVTDLRLRELVSRAAAASLAHARDDRSVW